MAEKPFFVGVYEPLDVRRNLLESSKEIVGSLQIYESLRQIRQEKLKTTEELRVLMTEIDLLISKLKNKLPETNLRKTINHGKKSTVTKSESSEMRKLEEQLRKIEKEFHKI